MRASIMGEWVSYRGVTDYLEIEKIGSPTKLTEEARSRVEFKTYYPYYHLSAPPRFFEERVKYLYLPKRRYVYFLATSSSFSLEEYEYIILLREEEGPLYYVNGTSLWDYFEVSEEEASFTWLAPSPFYREEVRTFENILNEIGKTHPKLFVMGLHYNISQSKVLSILDVLKISRDDLPSLIISKKRLDKEVPGKDVVILSGKFMDKLLMLPETSLRRILESFYIKTDVLDEKEAKRICKDEIKMLEGEVPKDILEEIKKMIDIIRLFTAISIGV